MQLQLTLAEVEALIEREFPQAKALYKLDMLEPMRARVRLVPEEAHLRRGGKVSGPTIFGLPDCAVYYAILRIIGPEALTVAISATIDYMRKPAPGTDLVADVELLKLGRALAVGDVRVRSEGTGDIVARATLTYSIPPKR